MLTSLGIQLSAGAVARRRTAGRARRGARAVCRSPGTHRGPTIRPQRPGDSPETVLTSTFSRLFAPYMMFFWLWSFSLRFDAVCICMVHLHLGIGLYGMGVGLRLRLGLIGLSQSSVIDSRGARSVCFFSVGMAMRFTRVGDSFLRTPVQLWAGTKEKTLGAQPTYKDKSSSLSGTVKQCSLAP